MDRLRAPSFRVFAAVSLLLHGSMLAKLVHGGAERRTPAFDPGSQTLAGETIVVDPSLPLPATSTEPSPEPAAPATTTAIREPSPHPGPPNPGAGATRSARLTSAPSAPPPLFGAVGVRFATDLATTFTRAFPQAGSADRTWAAAPFGAAGQAEVTLVLDEEGHLSGTSIAGSPSAALRRSIDRTLALVAPRSFTARGAVTRLHLSAQVSRDDVHDGLHGDVFALSGGSFSGDVGTAFFALPALPAAAAGGAPGRRVDVEVRMLP